MSERWYTADGEMVTDILKKDGMGTRKATVADARKHGYIPSVTTILGILDKPNLVKWKVRNAIECALTLPKLQDESSDDYFERVLNDSEEQAKKARQLGTDVHDCIERYLSKDEAHCASQEVAMIYQPAEEYLHKMELVGQCEKRVVGHRYAGKLDFVGMGLINGSIKPCIIDFKTTASMDIKNDCFYPEYLYQLCAYQMALDITNSKGYELVNISISTKNIGHIVTKVWDEKEKELGRKMFTKMVELFRLMKRL